MFFLVRLWDFFLLGFSCLRVEVEKVGDKMDLELRFYKLVLVVVNRVGK